MKKKVNTLVKKVRKKIVEYISTNRLSISFMVLSMIETTLFRYFIFGNPWQFMPCTLDFAIILIIVSISYFIKPSKQYNYYLIWSIILTLMCIINSVYYSFYMSFASFSLLASLSQVRTVTDSLTEKFRIIDFIYLAFPVIFYLIHKHLKSSTYYRFMAKIEKGKKMFAATLLVAVILIAVNMLNMDGTDYSRLTKLWNRDYNVKRFGIILYQFDDLAQSLTPKINSLFGYDEASKEFRDFYASLKQENDAKKNNKYTGVLDGMNVIFIHMESIQNFLIDKQVNGVELTPTINKLSKEGMYFSNFYPQISTGTSSDTEFTLNTSLMPALSGIVFVSYYDKEYVTIPKLLKEKGYYTFSMHANLASMWNRDKMHPSLGYDDFYSSTSFNITDENSVGLGLKDQEFFTQARSILEKIETENNNYMGTIIQLSNHSPFYATPNNHEIYDEYGKLDLTNTYTKLDEKTNETLTVTDDYLEGTKLGNYIKSAHYADMALGELFKYIEESEYYDNTVFVLYGDHDAKLNKNEYQYYYNYDLKTGHVYEEGEPNYVDFDYYQQEINRRTPLIIWTKNKNVRRKINTTNHNVIGMYDILPTLGNMMNFKSDFALGHDIYDIKDKNIVIFPNANFVTNKIYYNNSNSSYLALGNNIVLEDDYIENCKKYTEERLEVSNSIIVYDLIKRDKEKILPKIDFDEVIE